MNKYLKYVLAVATLLIACATFAFADGDPVVATLNGQPYSSLSDAVSASTAGDKLIVVSDCTLSSAISIPFDVHFLVPNGVTVTSHGPGITNNGFTEIYGNLVRDSSSAATSSFFLAKSGVTNIYGNVLSSNDYGNPVGFSTGADPGTAVNIYGGIFSGASGSLTNFSSNGLLTVYGGSFTPMFTPSSKIVLGNGAVITGNSVSWGGLYEISRIVTSSLSWISLFCASIVANKLLLIFLIFFMGFAAIGLIKRVVR